MIPFPQKCFSSDRGTAASLPTFFLQDYARQSITQIQLLRDCGGREHIVTNTTPRCVVAAVYDGKNFIKSRFSDEFPINDLYTHKYTRLFSISVKDSTSRWLTYQLSITPSAKFIRYLCMYYKDTFTLYGIYQQIRSD